MSKLTQEMKDMIGSQQCFIATVSENGIPNVGPKRSTRVIDDNIIAFTEGTGGTTFKNIVNGSKVAISVVNREILDGYRFVGNAEVLSSGELYERAVALSAQNGMRRPVAVVLIHIEQIHSLKPGPTAGKIIEE